MHPHTSIIVLTYNGLEVTKKFMHALYKYTTDFDLIVIDNGSKDETPDFLKTFSEKNNNIKLICNQENLGVIEGRNLGYNIYLSLENRSDYFLFLDNDQFCQPGWLDIHHDFMTEGRYDVVGAEAWLLNSSYWPVKNCKKPGEPFSYVGCGGMMIKQEVANKIGMFDKRFSPCYFEDPDYCFRVRQAGFKIGWNYKSRILHVPHQTLGKNSKRWHYLKQSHMRFREKWKSTKMLPMYQVKLPCLENLSTKKRLS